MDNELELTAEQIEQQEKANRESVLQSLREIANKSPRKITNADRIFVKAQAVKYEFEIPDNLGCASCWIDLAVLITKKINELYPVEQSGEYVLRDGVDVIWNGIRINEQTLTDALAAEYIANGFPTNYFAKWK